MGVFNREIIYMSLGEKDATKKKVFNGHLNITVQQYFSAAGEKTSNFRSCHALSNGIRIGQLVTKNFSHLNVLTF